MAPVADSLNRVLFNLLDEGGDGIRITGKNIGKGFRGVVVDCWIFEGWRWGQMVVITT